jgi:hypothetical protein
MEDLAAYTVNDYMKQIGRWSNTRHKNTLLWVWNKDCLSYSRLTLYGIVRTSECPNCSEYDSPTHMLFECNMAKQVWEKLMLKIKMSEPNACPICLWD